MTRDAFFATMRSAALDPWRPFADKVCAWVEDIEGKIDAWKTSASALPTQLIHGDLHYDNVLVEGDRITGLLDFEFAALDWRAMELAICLSKYAGEAEPMAFLQPFVEGYAEHGVLTADEVAAVPSLIILRILSNVVYFVGRALAKEDELSTLTKRIETYCKRVDWLTANADALTAIMREHFLAA